MKTLLARDCQPAGEIVEATTMLLAVVVPLLGELLAHLEGRGRR